MINVEPAFPRGHKGPTHGRTNRITKPKASDKHYGATILPEEKVRRLRPEQRRQLVMNEKKMDESETQQALNASHIAFSRFPIGILALACVKRITKTDLELTLPGRITGYVPISNISDAYSKRLQEMINTGSTNCPSLNDLYNCGDLVYAKLLHKNAQGERKTILSLNPSELHKEFAPSQLVAGLVLVATIVKKEDHGYFMNVGVRNVRAFLPNENLGQNQDDVGRNLFCSIESATMVGSGATVILKAFDPNAPRVLNVEEVDMDVIVPGCRLTFTVGEPVEFGLRGMLFEDMVPAYVNANMLTKVTSTPEKYSMFKKIPATLLYVMPITKQVFVSLKPYTNNRVETNVTYSPGTVIDKAYVKAVDGSGVWLQFGKKQRGLLPRKVIMNQAASSGNVDESVVMGNFQIGTTHKVFVLHYDPLENTYIVSNEHYDHDEVRTPDDIIIGNMYKCRVHKIVKGGALVTVGHVKGSLSYGYYDQQTPLKLNNTLLVRAVQRDCGTPFITFTNLPALLDEKASILYDWDQLDAAKNDQSFLGMVTRITPGIVLVRFFNNISGLLDKTQRQMDVAKVAELRVDTVEKFTVIEFDKATRKTFLTIPNSDEKIHSAIIVNATITCVHATGVDVRTEHGETGTVPSECFSEFGEHNSLYMRLLQEGQTLTLVKTNPGTYSVRLIPYFKTHPMHVESVERGIVLKGSCITVNGVLYVTPLLSNLSERIEIKTNENYRKVEDGSIVMMRVLNVKKSSAKGYELDVSTGLHNVCENGIMDVYSFIDEYLKDVNNLVQRYKEAKHAFANYTIGQAVECVIEKIIPASNKYAVMVHAIDKKSKHAAIGIATTVVPDQSATSYKLGKKVPGRVVWIDVERKLVHVCLDQSLFEHIVPLDKQLNVQISKELKSYWVLFANNYVRICCLQSGPPNALLIVPVKHHYNDMIDSANNTDNSVEVRLVKQLGQMVLATHGKMFQSFYMCRAQARAMVGNGQPQQIAPRILSNRPLIRCRQTTDTFDEASMLEEEETDVTDQSDYNSDSDTPQEEKDSGNSDEDRNEEEADASYDSMDEDEDEDYVYNHDKTDDESSPPTRKTNGTNNVNQQKKGLTSKLSSNGSNKSKLKRMIVADVKESAPQEHLPLKKKKKISPCKKTKKTKSAKKSILLIHKAEKSLLLFGRETISKKSTFVIDQLDGENDFYLPQLDGTDNDHIVPRDSKLGAKKRKRITGDKGLPGAINFWDSTPVYKRSVSDSSDNEADSSDNEHCDSVGKKRTTGKERFEAMKQEEERLRKIEDELANPSSDPHTPDQFERLVLAQPNNSMLWIRYMAFHMESAELDKSRAVGRKALKAIHFREETDRLNIWMALLNLEIRYETVDSFKDLLQEAVQYNDAFKVYSRAIDILIDCQKHAEVQEFLELLLKKFRKQNDMWFLVADAWYRIGQGGKVKPLLSQALKSLPTREHIPMIVKFAFLHNRNENRDEAHLLFEQILTSYPKRTDIWSQYIDMLVKDNLVGNARQILERAIMQRLPMKNMKTLYTKYVTFEEKHGDRDSVRRVKQMAADYVQAQLNNAGIK
ncbi:protein RRP5 homolog [Anopheles moucheti]|uniref:protein RRP5 homolog n=1 Tax=Anopheles moucheti TaxID=186751 RepID=UPI0022F12B07|nr:protein RRP5 homolog [Anopheles moucheti]